MRFILMVPASDKAYKQCSPYKGIAFPTKFHPYKTPRKEKYEQSLQKNNYPMSYSHDLKIEATVEEIATVSPLKVLTSKLVS